MEQWAPSEERRRWAERQVRQTRNCPGSQPSDSQPHRSTKPNIPPLSPSALPPRVSWVSWLVSTSECVLYRYVSCGCFLLSLHVFVVVLLMYYLFASCSDLLFVLVSLGAGYRTLLLCLLYRWFLFRSASYLLHVVSFVAHGDVSFSLRTVLPLPFLPVQCQSNLYNSIGSPVEIQRKRKIL